MRPNSLLNVIAVVVLSTTVGYAQIVETTLVDGCPVINCEAMVAAAYTTTPKGNTETVLKTTEANNKVYKRFAVYKSDNSTLSNFHDAFTVCSNIAGWRLPTQRELMLIWVLKKELENTREFTPFSPNYYYWSATEEITNPSWSFILDFMDGETAAYQKKSTCYVRCVREL